MAVPPDSELADWRERARETGVRSDILERTDDGHTGVVAVLNQGDGPCLGLRVDLDAISMEESAESDHRPAAEGFRSEHDGYMHACGHDAHLAIALGTIAAVKQSDFEGMLKVFSSPPRRYPAGKGDGRERVPGRRRGTCWRSTWGWTTRPADRRR